MRRACAWGDPALRVNRHWWAIAQKRAARPPAAPAQGRAVLSPQGGRDAVHTRPLEALGIRGGGLCVWLDGVGGPAAGSGQRSSAPLTSAFGARCRCSPRSCPSLPSASRSAPRTRQPSSARALTRARARCVCLVGSQAARTCSQDAALTALLSLRLHAGRRRGPRRGRSCPAGVLRFVADARLGAARGAGWQGTPQRARQRGGAAVCKEDPCRDGEPAAGDNAAQRPRDASADVQTGALW